MILRDKRRHGPASTWAEVTDHVSPASIRDGSAFVLPLYPGMTAKDIEDNASAIAAAVEQHFAAADLTSRIRRLGDEGLSRTEIGNRLGVTLDTIKRARREAKHSSE
jgi:DNA-directed RNA polymerase specialized sigma24 family protein